MKKLELLIIGSIIILIVSACGNSGGSNNLPPTLNPSESKGKSVFTAKCASCHTTSPGLTIVGPSLAGIATVADTRISGLNAREYIIHSLMSPDEFLVEGFKDLMPKSLSKSLTSEEFDSVVDYLMTLK